MNLGEAKVVFRPRSVGEVFDLAALVTTRGAPRLLGAVAAGTLLPGYLVALALRYGAGWSWLAVWLAAWVWASLATGAFTLAVGRWLLAEAPTAPAVLRDYLRALPRFVGTWLWGRLFTIPAALFAWPLYFAFEEVGARLSDDQVWGVGTLLVFVGLLLVPAQQQTLFLYETAFLERLPAARCVGRSRQFVKALGGRAWKMAFLLLLAPLAAAVGGELLGQAIVEDVLQLGPVVEHLGLSGGSPFALAGLFLATPFLAAARFLFYVDGRTRVDGWDIQVRFLAIASQAETSPVRRAA